MPPLSLDRDHRVAFVELDREAADRLPQLWQIVEPHLPRILDDFYDHLGGVPALAALIGDKAKISHLKDAQKTHWQQLFSGRFDETYMAAVSQIGAAHERIGLEPRWYIGAYGRFLCAIAEVLGDKHRRNGRAAGHDMSLVVKALLLDMDLAISVYFARMQETARETLSGHADRFEASVLGMVDSVAGSAEQLLEAAGGMTQNASETADRATVVASASEEASVSVQTVAAAAEQLSRSITEISGQVSESSRISQEVVDQAERTNETVNGLSHASEKIGEVIDLIQDIAEQTNLLALNATIEAARAGEAGKGFAVVAQEVKNLANQTARATGDIGQQVEAIRSSVKDSVQAIQGIGTTIARLNEISSAIAAAVEEQSAATSEISRNTQEASTGTQEVSDNIAGVSQAAAVSGETAGTLQGAANQLNQQSEDLRQAVDGFLKQIRAA